MAWQIEIRHLHGVPQAFRCRRDLTSNFDFSDGLGPLILDPTWNFGHHRHTAAYCSKGRTPQTAAYSPASLETATLTEAHHANVRFNPCVRKGANVARWALECCGAAAYCDAEGLRARIWSGRAGHCHTAAYLPALLLKWPF